MNQGIFFGQMVIGPAGSGKVIHQHNNSLLTVSKCKIWLKLSKEI